MLFDNRAFGWKLAGAGALVLALGALSGAWGARVKPAAWRCLAQPSVWDGREVWFPSVSVLSRTGDGFVVEADRLPLRVVGAADVRPGDRIGVSGRFEASGPHLRLREIRRHGALQETRWIVEAVSIAVLAIVLINFLRHFTFRPSLVRVEGAD